MSVALSGSARSITTEPSALSANRLPTRQRCGRAQNRPPDAFLREFNQRAIPLLNLDDAILNRHGPRLFVCPCQDNAGWKFAWERWRLAGVLTGDTPARRQR